LCGQDEDALKIRVQSYHHAAVGTPALKNLLVGGAARSVNSPLKPGRLASALQSDA